MTEIILSQDYDSHNYEPAMPILDIGISRPNARTAAVTIEAIVDTGADATLIPINLLEGIGATSVAVGYVRGITGAREQVDVYLVTLHIANFRIYGVRVGGLLSSDTAILGRDVVNQLDIALLGPAGVLEVRR